MYKLELTPNECLYISDALCSHTVGPAGESWSAYPGFLLKLSGAILESRGGAQTYITVDMTDLFVLRDICKSGVMFGSERVGLNLLYKVSEGLLSESLDVLIPGIFKVKDSG